MAPPDIRRYSHGDRVYVRAQQVWMILVAHVMMTKGLTFRERLLSYGQLAARMGISPQAAIGLGRELGIIGEYCLQNGLPALNCIVVNQLSWTPGDSVVVGRKKTWRDEARDSHNEDWFKYRVPSTGTLRQVWEEMSAEAA